MPRRQRIAVALWIVVGVVVWNAVFDMWVLRGVKAYLFHAALSGAGRGPVTPIAHIMAPAIDTATWVATLWASGVVLTGLLALRLARPQTQ